MSGKWEMAIGKRSRVSCHGGYHANFIIGAESLLLSVTITTGSKYSGIPAVVPVGLLVCSM